MAGVEVTHEVTNPFTLPPSYLVLMMGDYFVQKAEEASTTYEEAMKLAAQKTIQFAKDAGGYGA